MDLHKTDAEFMEIAGRFAFDEVVNEPEARLEPATRWLAVLAALTGCQGLELYRKLLPRALDEGLPPVWAKEAAYQAVDYLGLGRALPFVEAASEVFAARGLELPGCGEARRHCRRPAGEGRGRPGGDLRRADAGGLEGRAGQPLAGGQLLRRLLHPLGPHPGPARDDNLLLPHGPGRLRAAASLPRPGAT